jgi:hypothetical protein
MIPLFAIVRVSPRKHRSFSLWLPLFLVWLLLLPVVVLLIPFVLLGCLIVRLNPWRVFSTGWQLIAGLKGTDVDVEGGQAKVLVRVF